MYRILFLGTSDLALPSLEALLSDPRFEIIGIVTQPDRPAGRHAELKPSPVKVVAEKHGLRVWQPEKLSDLRNPLYPPYQGEADQNPPDKGGWGVSGATNIDAAVIVSYGKILPQWLLDLPKHGVLNVHPSLLPRWRGTSPFQTAIAAGDTLTGVSIMKIDELMDHGPVLAQTEEPILETDTGKTLHDRLAKIGAQMLPDVLADYLAEKIQPREQDHALATFCKMLSREDGRIDWTKSAQEIEHLVRAYDPWPGTWTQVGSKRLKILSTKIVPADSSHQPGELIVKENKLFMSCGAGTVLELLRVQPEGKKEMSGQEFARGRL